MRACSISAQVVVGPHRRGPTRCASPPDPRFRGPILGDRHHAREGAILVGQQVHCEFGGASHASSLSGLLTFGTVLYRIGPEVEGGPGKSHREGISSCSASSPMTPPRKPGSSLAEWHRGRRVPALRVNERADRSQAQDHAVSLARRNAPSGSDRDRHGRLEARDADLDDRHLPNGDQPQAVSSMLHRDLRDAVGVVPQAHRLRVALSEDGGLFQGPVGESYFADMSNAKRRELADQGVGRGAVGKTAVVGVKDRATKRCAPRWWSARTARRSRASSSRTRPLTRRSTARASAYEGMPFDHDAVKHSVEFVRQRDGILLVHAQAAHMGTSTSSAPST